MKVAIFFFVSALLAYMAFGSPSGSVSSIYPEPVRSIMYFDCLRVGFTVAECQCHEEIVAPKLKVATIKDMTEAVEACKSKRSVEFQVPNMPEESEGFIL